MGATSKVGSRQCSVGPDFLGKQNICFMWVDKLSPIWEQQRLSWKAIDIAACGRDVSHLGTTSVVLEYSQGFASCGRRRVSLSRTSPAGVRPSKGFNLWSDSRVDICHQIFKVWTTAPQPTSVQRSYVPPVADSTNSTYRPEIAAA